MQTHDYQNILIAVDVFSDYEPILERGLKMAKSSSNVSLIHVLVPEVIYEPYGVIFPTEFVGQVRDRANEKLMSIAEKHDIAPEKVFIPVGRPADEIQELSENINTDLIVIGTHGRSGISLLLGSTANAVLHGVKRDVLAVRI